MSARHHSFTLSRSGLKAGYYVPARLRIVDTLSIFSGVPMVIVVIATAMASFRWANQFGLGVIWRNPIAFTAYLAVVILLARWTVSLTVIAVLRFVFRVTGMMSQTEAQFYPLRADKKCVDPWPEAWQTPHVGHANECATEPLDARETSAQSVLNSNFYSSVPVIRVVRQIEINGTFTDWLLSEETPAGARVVLDRNHHTDLQRQ